MAVLRHGDLPVGVISTLTPVGIDVDEVAPHGNLESLHRDVACVLLPISNACPSDIGATVRALARTLPIVIVNSSSNCAGAFAAGRAGALGLVNWPQDRPRLLEVIRESWKQFDDASNVRMIRHSRLDQLKRLTERQKQVIRGIIEGKVNKQMAIEQGISQKTIEYHRSRAMQKLRVTSVAELVRLVMEADSD